MKPSLLVTVALALLVGLSLVVGLKYAGVFNSPPEKKDAMVAAPTPPSVVVAAHNVYAGDTIGPGDVRVRPLNAAEWAGYQKNSGDYLPPVAEAAQFRTAQQNIEADRPITKDLLEPMGKPEPLHARLLPLTRAVDLQVAAENSAAGLIQVNDWVDVFLTTEVGRTDGGDPSVRTALLARNAQVVAKRGTLYHTYAPLPPGPIQFTVAANRYRAALIDYARNRGVISLQPVSMAEKTKLDALQPIIEKEPEQVVALTAPADSPDFAEELRRVQAHDHGEAVCCDEDLMRVLGLKPLMPATVVTVEYFHGVKRTGGSDFLPEGDGYRPYPHGDRPTSYTFMAPKAPAKTTH